jgi:hypothetical protein
VRKPANGSSWQTPAKPMRQYTPLKRPSTSKRLYGAIAHKTVILFHPVHTHFLYNPFPPLPSKRIFSKIFLSLIYEHISCFTYKSYMSSVFDYHNNSNIHRLRGGNAVLLLSPLLLNIQKQLWVSTSIEKLVSVLHNSSNSWSHNETVVEWSRPPVPQPQLPHQLPISGQYLLLTITHQLAVKELDDLLVRSRLTGSSLYTWHPHFLIPMVYNFLSVWEVCLFAFWQHV